MINKQWFLTLPKSVYVIAVAVLIIVFLLSIRNCSNNRQDDQAVIGAVAQSKIDQLNKELIDKDNELTVNKQSILRLYALIKSKDSTIYLKDIKLAQTASKLSTELKKNHGLTDEEAVLQFMDNSGYSDSVVTKYENRYNVPICAIRAHNDISSNLDIQKDVNLILAGKVADQSEKIVFMDKVIQLKDKDIDALNDKFLISGSIIAEKDTQIEAEHKKYKQQRVKTWITGGIGIVLLTLSLLR